MKHLLFVFCCGLCLTGFSQTFSLQPKGKPKEVAFDFHLFQTRFIQHPTRGIQLDGRYYPQKWLAIGMGLTSSKTSAPQFKTSTLTHPSVYFLETAAHAWLDFIQLPRFRLSGLFAPGVLATGIQNEVFATNPWTGKIYSDAPQVISRRVLTSLQSGFSASFRIYSNQHQPDIFVTGQWRYRKTWGQHPEIPQASFNGPQWNIGITLIGWDRDLRKSPTYLFTSL